MCFDLFWFAVSEAAVFVESQLCGIVFPKGFLGIVSPFSTALYVPGGFSDKRFETAPDLSFPKYLKLVLANR
ncbi:hypothetical protein OWC56_22620 [Vibrio diabolicus]|nr:hypothetical protein [Vibrio diabolicus]MCZ0761588.1 hypothetical protein [Vibrio diabolicus]